MGGIFFIFLLTIAHVSLLLNSVMAVNPKKGFSIKMVHRDSKESPLYPGGHLTREERLQRLVDQSKARARYIESKILLQNNATRSMTPDAARLPVVYELQMFYVATIGIGTFPGRRQSFMNYQLLVDSGSDVTWLQCKGANKTFPQDKELYPWKTSTTYHPVPCNRHPLCHGDSCNIDGQCTYVQDYMNGAITSGIIAEEIVTLGSNTGGLESFKLRMGCGLKQQGFEVNIGNNRKQGKSDLIAGILGLGSGPWSFINQLGAAGEGKFAYCFEPYNYVTEGSKTYLSFGADATIGGEGQEVHKTPIVVPNFKSEFYYLKLKDISVGRKKANFPKNTFERNKQGEGGTVIDSGNPYSVMFKYHFDRVAELVKAHFFELGVEYIGFQSMFDICFRLPRGFEITDYPSITLHFQHADYIIDYTTSFPMTSEDTTCLAIMRGERNSPAFILGAIQQANKRILYDVMNLTLSFATEDCRLGL